MHGPRQPIVRRPARRLLFSPTPSPLISFPRRQMGDAFQHKRSVGLILKKNIGRLCNTGWAYSNLQSGSSNLKVFVRGRVRHTVLHVEKGPFSTFSSGGPHVFFQVTHLARVRG